LIHDLYINRYGAGTQLRNQGYDIITYNITSPIISIDVNAKLFAKFIQFVNNQKEGDEEIIIMGVSMGGLVTRHALTYMEENNIQHQTKLFISFDSPQAGAHIPISMQEMSYDFAVLSFLSLVMGGVEGAEEVMALYSTLRSPAALEMNLFDLFKIENGRISSADCYETFHNNLKSLNNCNGYPKNCKNIAISNGSLKGDLQTGLNSLGNTSGNPAIKFHINNFNAFQRTLTTVAGSDNSSVSGVCPYVGIQSCNSDEEFYISNYREPIEHTPGGYYNWYGMLENIINEYDAFELDYINTRRASYIPTYSSLDLYTNNPLIDLSSYGKAVVLDNSPFDDIWWETTHDNLSHTSLTSQISNYLIDQITNYSTSDNYCKDYNLTINNVIIPNGKKELSKASNDLSIENTTVLTGGALTVKSGNKIILQPGFSVEAGADFHALIEPCSIKSCNKLEELEVTWNVPGYFNFIDRCINFIATPIGGNEVYSYKWYVDGSYVSSNSSYLHCPKSWGKDRIKCIIKSGLYTVELNQILSLVSD